MLGRKYSIWLYTHSLPAPTSDLSLSMKKVEMPKSHCGGDEFARRGKIISLTLPQTGRRQSLDLYQAWFFHERISIGGFELARK